MRGVRERRAAVDDVDVLAIGQRAVVAFARGGAQFFHVVDGRGVALLAFNDRAAYGCGQSCRFHECLRGDACVVHAGAAVHGVGLLHDYDVLAIVGKRTAQGEARRSEPDDRCVELFHGASFRRDPKGGRSIRGMLHAAEDVYRRAPDRPAGDGRRSARKRS